MPPARPPWLTKPKGLNQDQYQRWYTRVKALMEFTPPELLASPTSMAEWWESPAAPTDAEIVRGAIVLLEEACNTRERTGSGALGAPEAPVVLTPGPLVEEVGTSPPAAEVRYVQCGNICSQCTNQCERDARHKGRCDCEQHADFDPDE
jgi:hypothetical protein